MSKYYKMHDKSDPSMRLEVNPTGGSVEVVLEDTIGGLELGAEIAPAEWKALVTEEAKRLGLIPS